MPGFFSRAFGGSPRTASPGARAHNRSDLDQPSPGDVEINEWDTAKHSSPPQQRRLRKSAPPGNAQKTFNKMSNALKNSLSPRQSSRPFPSRAVSHSPPQLAPVRSASPLPLPLPISSPSYDAPRSPVSNHREEKRKSVLGFSRQRRDSAPESASIFARRRSSSLSSRRASEAVITSREVIPPVPTFSVEKYSAAPVPTGPNPRRSPMLEGLGIGVKAPPVDVFTPPTPPKTPPVDGDRRPSLRSRPSTAPAASPTGEQPTNGPSTLKAQSYAGRRLLGMTNAPRPVSMAVVGSPRMVSHTGNARPRSIIVSGDPPPVPAKSAARQKAALKAAAQLQAQKNAEYSSRESLVSSFSNASGEPGQGYPGTGRTVFPVAQVNGSKLRESIFIADERRESLGGSRRGSQTSLRALSSQGPTTSGGMSGRQVAAAAAMIFTSGKIGGRASYSGPSGKASGTGRTSFSGPSASNKRHSRGSFSGLDASRRNTLATIPSYAATKPLPVVVRPTENFGVQTPDWSAMLPLPSTPLTPSFENRRYCAPSPSVYSVHTMAPSIYPSERDMDRGPAPPIPTMVGRYEPSIAATSNYGDGWEDESEALSVMDMPTPVIAQAIPVNLRRDPAPPVIFAAPPILVPAASAASKGGKDGDIIPVHFEAPEILPLNIKSQAGLAVHSTFLPASMPLSPVHEILNEDRPASRMTQRTASPPSQSSHSPEGEVPALISSSRSTSSTSSNTTGPSTLIGTEEDVFDRAVPRVLRRGSEPLKVNDYAERRALRQERGRSFFLVQAIQNQNAGKPKERIKSHFYESGQESEESDDSGEESAFE